MKKLLAILLSMLMLAGVFGVGASAAPTNAQEEFAALYGRVVDEILGENPWLFYFQDVDFLAELLAIPSATREGVNWQALLRDYDPYRLMEEFMNELYEEGLFAFENNEATLAAAIADSRAEAAIRRLYTGFIDIYRAFAFAVEDALVPEAAAFLNAVSRVHNRGDLFDGLDQGAVDALAAQVVGNADLDAMFAAGQWAELAAIYTALAEGLEALVVAAGGTVPAFPGIFPPRALPSSPPWHETLPAFVQWIFRWIFFGWLWM